MNMLHKRAHDLWASAICILALAGAVYILILAKAPPAAVALVLVGACLLACAFATVMALRIRKKVDNAVHDLSKRID